MGRVASLLLIYLGFFVMCFLPFRCLLPSLLVCLALSPTSYAITYQYDAFDRLVTSGLDDGVVYQYRYDLNGNLQTRQAKQSCVIGADSDNDGMPDCIENREVRDNSVKDNAIFGQTALNARWLVMQQYRDFLGREGDVGGIEHWQRLLLGQTLTRAQTVQNFFDSAEFQVTRAPIVRLYFAYFNRIPDYGGLMFHSTRLKQGVELKTISGDFSGSQEFQNTYGALSNGQFVTLVYQNVLGRAPDAGGYQNWLNALNNGMTRGEMMMGFSESVEYKSSSYKKVYVTMSYVGLLRRSPEQAGFDGWLTYLNQGGSGLAMLEGFIGSPEYHNRFLP